MLENVEFREVHEIAKVDKVKIVACDGKGEPQKWKVCKSKLLFSNRKTL